MILVRAVFRQLRLNDPINGHRAIRAGLGRGVDHGIRILMKDFTVDGDCAAVPLRRGAENLTVRQRRVLRIQGDRAPNRLRATRDRGVELCVREADLVGLHLDRAAVPQRRDRAVLTGEQMSAIDKNGASITGRRGEGERRRRVCGKVGVGETYGLLSRYANRSGRPITTIIHGECATA